MTHPMLALRVSLICASACLAACTSHAPGNLTAETQTRLATIADEQGNTGMALSLYQVAATSSASDISAQIRYADALARSGKIQQAQRWLQQSLLAHPDQPDLQRASALVDIVGGNAVLALPKLDALLLARPQDTSVLTDKGVALDLLRRHAEAQALYRQALQLAPDDVAVRNNLALSMMLSGQQREAQSVLEPAAADADAPVRVKVNMGILYAAAGDVPKAQQMVRDQVDQKAIMLLAGRVNQAAAAPEVSLR